MTTIFEELVTIFDPTNVETDSIKLHLKARHFLGKFHDDNINGVFPTALRDSLKTAYINARGDDVQINDEIYYHQSYTKEMYYHDRNLAAVAGYDETIIRTINLTKAL